MATKWIYMVWVEIVKQNATLMEIKKRCINLVACGKLSADGTKKNQQQQQQKTNITNCKT